MEPIHITHHRANYGLGTLRQQTSIRFTSLKAKGKSNRSITMRQTFSIGDQDGPPESQEDKPKSNPDAMAPYAALCLSLPFVLPTVIGSLTLELGKVFAGY